MNRAASQPVLDDSIEELYDHAPCGYLSTTADGTIIKVNQTLLDWTGLQREDVVGTTRFAELITPGARVYYLTHHVPQLERAGVIRGVSLDLRRLDGTTLPVLLHSVMASDHLIRTTVFDATERRAYESSLHAAKDRAEASERRLAVLHQVASACTVAVTADGLAEAVAGAVARGLDARGCAVWLVEPEGSALRRAAAVDVLDVLADPCLAYDASAPPAEARRLGRTTVVGSSQEPAPPELAAALTRHGVDSVVSVPLRFEREVLGVLGLYLRRSHPLSGDDLALLETVGTQVGQALERVRLHAELQRQALHDPLTGLPNRILLRDRLTLALSRAEASGTGVAVLVVDLDGFKGVNDRCGHAAGDSVLIEAAQRLLGAARPVDTVARIGGDEFVVVCEHVDAVATAALVRRVELALRLTVAAAPELRVSASVGSALHRGSDGPGDVDALLEQADRAMYDVKRRS